MSSPDNPDVPEVPRVEELFSRAVVAQLAEQRAQRETFSEVERKLEALERLVTERLGDLTRQLGTDGQLEGRIEQMEEALGSRLNAVERVVRAELDNRLGAMAERLSQVEQSIGSDETGAKLVALEATVRRRLTNLEEAVRADDVPDRLGRLERQLTEGFAGNGGGSVADPAFASRLEALERSVTERLTGVEESLQTNDVARRLGALETQVTDRLGHLEETVRSEEIGRRLKALELALDERSGRIEEFVKAADLEHRIEALGQAVDQRLAELRTSLFAHGDDVPVGPLPPVAAAVKLDDAVNERLAGLEGSLVRLQEDTAARLDALREASMASEAGILERIIAESHVVGAHFQAVRPVVEAAVAARPEIEQALFEVRKLADAARSAAAELVAGVAGPPAPQPEDSSGPYRVETLAEAAAAAATDGDHEEPADSVFQPPEETPIPDRRFGILPRRDR
jgi:uncharacterized damage-inducible protein DinB